MDSIRQVGWSAWWNDVTWSTNAAIYGRFSITRATDGYVVADHREKVMERTTTLAAAQAWAGIRVGERCVRHPQKVRGA